MDEENFPALNEKEQCSSNPEESRDVVSSTLSVESTLGGFGSRCIAPEDIVNVAGSTEDIEGVLSASSPVGPGTKTSVDLAKMTDESGSVGVLLGAISSMYLLSTGLVPCSDCVTSMTDPAAGEDQSIVRAEKRPVWEQSTCSRCAQSRDGPRGQKGEQIG